MNTNDYQLQTRRFLRQAVKALSLFASILILGSFTTSHAQNRDVSVLVRFDKECGPNASTVLQMWIGATKWAEGFSDISVPPGPHDLRAIVKKEPRPDLFITRIWYRDVVLPDQISTFNAPEANVSITVSPPPPPGSEAAQRVARLEIDLTCGVPPAGGKLPIIFLPGVAGTELVRLERPEQDNVDCSRGIGFYCYSLWPTSLEQERAKLGLKEDGKTPALLPVDYRIAVGKILAGTDPSLSPLDFYGNMMYYLQRKGYDFRPNDGTHMSGGLIGLATPKIPSLFAFPYDWRLDNATHFTALDSRIDEALKQNPNAKKVILLAHSMGGYIARAYILSSAERAAKVDSLITMGAPYWGAPKPYYGAVSGYTFGNKTVRQELMKILIQNFPAAYQLMPNYPFIKDANANDRRLTLKESSRIRYKGFTDVTPTINISKDKYEETADNIWSLNTGLVKLAEDFNRPFGSRDNPRDNPTPLPAGVKHYVIIGTGVQTLMFFRMRNARVPPERFVELDGRKVVLEPIFGNGDGTVPLHGSRIRTATRTYYIPYLERWGPDNSSAHGDLPANTTVQKIVGEIIDGNPPASSKEEPPADFTGGLVDLEKGVDFTLRSDAYLSLTDQSTGRKLGFNNQGGIDEDLPSGTFIAMEGVEYASIADINRTLGVTVTGIRDGKFTLDVNIKRPGGAATQFSYREVPVRNGTIAQVTLTPAKVSAPPPLTVTTDGRTTTIPASGSAGGSEIPQGGTPVSPLPPSSGGIGGTWTAPTGDIIELIQNGNRITGRYRGILGTGEITGTFDGKNLSATVRPNQALLPLAIPLTLTLMEDGKLSGRLETPLMSGSLVFTRTGR